MASLRLLTYDRVREHPAYPPDHRESDFVCNIRPFQPRRSAAIP